MAKKLVLVFAMCMVVLAAVYFNKAEAADIDSYRDCFNTCHEQCFQDGKGQGYTFCEMKCDSECGAKELKDKLNHLVP